MRDKERRAVIKSRDKRSRRNKEEVQTEKKKKVKISKRGKRLILIIGILTIVISTGVFFKVFFAVQSKFISGEDVTFGNKRGQLETGEYYILVRGGNEKTKVYLDNFEFFYNDLGTKYRYNFSKSETLTVQIEGGKSIEFVK